MAESNLYGFDFLGRDDTITSIDLGRYGTDHQACLAARRDLLSREGVRAVNVWSEGRLVMHGDRSEPAPTAFAAPEAVPAAAGPLDDRIAPARGHYAVFADRSQAEAACRALHEAGFDPAAVSLIAPQAPADGLDEGGAVPDGAVGDVFGSLARLGLSKSSAAQCEKTFQRGRTVLLIKGDHDGERARMIAHDAGALEFTSFS